MNPDRTPKLDHFLSQLRWASAVFGADGSLVCASPRFAMLFGPSREGTPYEEAFSSCPWLAEKIAQVFRDRVSYALHEVALFPETADDPHNVDIFPLAGESASFTGVAVNVTEARERSLFSEQKDRTDALARLGLVAGGLAHEIKNPLSGLRGAAQLILQDLDDARRLGEYAAIIAKESDRIDRLVRELLDFTKPRELRTRKLNVNRLLRDVREAAALAASRGVTFRESFDPSLPEVSGDEDALKQVFLNLVKNAVEASPENGVVSLKSQMVTDFVLKTAGGKRRFVGIHVEDRGCGMDEKQLRNLFLPYYTTKPQGTGLGLAVVNRLVELHDGNVAVRSKKGEGTTFTVYLPL